MDDIQLRNTDDGKPIVFIHMKKNPEEEHSWLAGVYSRQEYAVAAVTQHGGYWAEIALNR